MPVINPETKTIHLSPRAECNLERTKAYDDPGPDPFKVPWKEARRLMREEDYEICENDRCNGDAEE